MIAERLAACACILGSISTVCLWHGEVCESPETALMLKTRPELITPLTERVKELRSYGCPCIAVLSIVGRNPDHITWF